MPTLETVNEPAMRAALLDNALTETRLREWIGNAGDLLADLRQLDLPTPMQGRIAALLLRRPR